MRGLFLLSLVLTSLVSIHGQAFNYLIQAHEAAMAMKSNFDYNAAYYREYVNYETESLSYNLNELVAQALERSTTEAQGAAIRDCAVIASYYATGIANPVLDDLYVIQDAALIYYRIILEELTSMNVFATDLEIFYYQFNLRLNESYLRLNDVLLANVLNALFDLLDGSRVVFNTLDNCLNAIN